MNINQLEELIFKSSSNFMRRRGEEIFRYGLVSDIRGKKVGNMYCIYGKVLNSRNENQFNTYIKIDLLNKKLKDVNCNCVDYKSLSVDKKLFMCEHLTASAYKFLDSFKRKNNREEEPVKNLAHGSQEKIYIDIDTRISHKLWKGTTSYEVEFRLVCKHKYLITDLKNFIFSLDSRKNIFLNNTFSYNPKKHIFSESSIKIIDFIREYTRKNNKDSIVGRNLIISPEDLRRFLECAGEDNIQFRYNDMEYSAKVNKSDLPLSFTLKDKEDYFVLTTHKKFPIPLNESNSVYLFNGDLYLPSKNQVDKYNLLYDKLLKKGRILYNKTLENYYALSSLLNSISKNVNFSEGVKNFIFSLSKFEFVIYKEDNDIYCDVILIYNNEKVNILEDTKDKRHIVRDLNKEEKVKMKLEYYKLIKTASRFKFIGNDEDIFNILTNKREGIYLLGKVVIGRGMEDISIFEADSIEIDLYEEFGELKLNYNIGNANKSELADIFKSYDSGNKFYKTRNGGFINLQDENIKSFLNLIEVLNINKSNEYGSVKVEDNKAFYIAESIKNKGYKVKNGNNLIEDIDNKLKSINNEGINVPENLKINLREYQIVGFKWFKILRQLELGGILADEMGLGKTAQAIVFLASEENKKALVITPTSLIYNWKSEIERFAPSLRTGIAYGEKCRIKKVVEEIESYDVILSTYGTIKNNIKQFSDVEFDLCIIDEGQNIKNPATQNAKAVKDVNAKLKFALTGTPIENNLMELWSIFDFIMPGYLYSKEIFDKKFIAKAGCGLDELKLLIKPFILRRTKKEVIDELPDKIEKKVLIDMTPAQKVIYNQYIKSVKEKVKGNSQGKIEIFSYLTKLRQICIDPSLISEDYKGGSGKIKVAMEFIENQLAIDGKVLLFSQFTSALKKIGGALKEKDIEYFYLDGATPSHERINLVNEFNENNRVKVFLISLKAGGTGLNLTSANLVIHFDPWWNPSVENQATDRAHRIGQKNVVEVIKLVARGTVEENIIALQEYKEELIGKIVDGELNSNTLSGLSRDELVELLIRHS